MLFLMQASCTGTGLSWFLCGMTYYTSWTQLEYGYYYSKMLYLFLLELPISNFTALCLCNSLRTKLFLIMCLKVIDKQYIKYILSYTRRCSIIFAMPTTASGASPYWLIPNIYQTTNWRKAKNRPWHSLKVTQGLLQDSASVIIYKCFTLFVKFF